MPETLALRAARLFKTRLQELYPEAALEVRLYGSRARGDAHEESDLDLLVLIPDNEQSVRRLAAEAVFRVYAELDYPFVISPQVMSHDHFAELLRRERLYAQEVVRDGIPI